jgi:hypothetical protein
MANTYLLLIDQLYIQPVQNIGTEDQLVDVVTAIDFRYEGTSEHGTVVNYRHTKHMEDPDKDGFTSYSDVTYEMAQGWCWHSEAEESEIYKILDDKIKDIETPKYVKPEKMPWEELPPGQQEIDAQNAQTEE